MLTQCVTDLTFSAVMERGTPETPTPRPAPDPFRTHALASSNAYDARAALAPRSSRAPGMHLGHELLLALTMAIAFAMLGATTWLWTLR
jgi:hypothetical protein